MEERLQELEISFDEFTVLYKTFRTPTPVEKNKEKIEAIPPNPFPWVSHAGAGWSSK